MGRNALDLETFRKRIGVLRTIETIIERGKARTTKQALAIIQSKCSPEDTGLPTDLEKAFKIIRKFKSDNNPDKIKIT